MVPMYRSWSPQSISTKISTNNFRVTSLSLFRIFLFSKVNFTTRVFVFVLFVLLCVFTVPMTVLRYP